MVPNPVSCYWQLPPGRQIDGKLAELFKGVAGTGSIADRPGPILLRSVTMFIEQFSALEVMMVNKSPYMYGLTSHMHKNDSNGHSFTCNYSARTGPIQHRS